MKKKAAELEENGQIAVVGHSECFNILADVWLDNCEFKSIDDVLGLEHWDEEEDVRNKTLE